jgi:hypothetical protein
VSYRERPAQSGSLRTRKLKCEQHSDKHGMITLCGRPICATAPAARCARGWIGGRSAHVKSTARYQRMAGAYPQVLISREPWFSLKRITCRGSKMLGRGRL